MNLFGVGRAVSAGDEEGVVVHQTRFERSVPSENIIEHALGGSVQESFWVEDAPLGAPNDAHHG